MISQPTVQMELYAELRRMIGVITDDNFFFNGTLRENIAWNVEHFDEF